MISSPLKRKPSGARCIWAASAAEARDTAGDICRASGARMIVKGKSNVTEEIGLNEHLEDLGIQVIETDLGEWIVQIADDRPSHTLAPALHMTRERMTRLISDAAGREVPDEREALVRAARDTLRRAFFDADVGISGGNFAIAETGTLVLVTNEGNGRLLSTLPPVYIAIVGVEKIVPSLQDVTDILPAAYGKCNRPENQHLRLVDDRSEPKRRYRRRPNFGRARPSRGARDPGRQRTAGDARGQGLSFRAQHVFKCGACSNVCPPFRIVGGHAFGYVYSGPIGLVVTGHHHGFANIADPQSLWRGLQRMRDSPVRLAFRCRD